jgi:hypothetical protein
MDPMWNEEDRVPALVPEIVAVGLLDLTETIIDDEEALDLMLDVVMMAIEFRRAISASCN